MLLSRSDLLQQYKLTEQTLVQLEALDDSPLMNGDKQSVVRGRIMYDVDPALDGLLTVGRAHYSCLHGTLLPCHRTILYLMISEADVTRACQALRGRGIVFAKITDKYLADTWQDFLGKVPPECVPYLTGKTNDDSAPLVQQLLTILEISDMLADPERVVAKSDWLNSPELRTLTDAFLAAHSDTETVRKYLAKAHRFDVTDDQIREYRRYFFDCGISGKTGVMDHAASSAWPFYRSSVGNAAKNGSVGEVVAELALDPLIDAKISLTGALRHSRMMLVPSPSRKTGMATQTNAFKASLEAYHTLNTLERAVVENNSSHDAADLELLKLKHDQEVNKGQLSVQDLPKEARDALVSGPIKAKS